MAEPDLSLPPARPSAELPLLGMTILAVEDSRFAAEALRLVCLRAGARLRRADSMAQAERHLALYAPDCLIVDCGLPDGDGCALIAKAHAGAHRPPVILGLSGDADQRPRVMAAGADGFLGKPLPGLPQLLRLMHPRPLRRSVARGPVPLSMPEPEAVALRDDLRHALDLIGRTVQMPGYISGFLGSLALQSGDAELAAAAADYRLHPQDGKRLRALITARLEEQAPKSRRKASGRGMMPRPDIAHLRPALVAARTGPA